MTRPIIVSAVLAVCVAAAPARTQDETPPGPDAETLSEAIALCLTGVRENRALSALTSPGVSIGDRPGVRPSLSGAAFLDDLDGPSLRLTGPGEVYVSKGAYCAIGARSGTGPAMAEAAAAGLEADAASWSRSPASQSEDGPVRSVYCAEGPPALATVVTTAAAGETDMTLTAMVTAIPRHVSALCPQ